MTCAECFLRDARDEDVGVVAAGHCRNCGVCVDSRGGQQFTVETDADKGLAREVLAKTSERLGTAVDHDYVVTTDDKGARNVGTDTPATDNDDMHGYCSYCSSVSSPWVWIGTETTAVCGR